MKLLSGVLFLKVPYAPLCTALILRQITICDLGPGWTFPETEFGFSSGFKLPALGLAEGKTQPPHRAWEASRLCSHSGPSGFVLGSGLASPKPEVIWGRLNIHT